MVTPIRVDSQQVVAFRLAGHHLSQRLPPRGLTDAAAACGIQNSPPGSAALALSARVEGLSPADLTRAMEIDKTLLQIRSLRGAPHLVPTRDMATFTTGLLPQDEDELRFFILGARPALDKVGISATRLVNLTAGVLLDALDGRVMTFRALSSYLTKRVAEQLLASQLATWQSPGGFGPGQSLGEALIHFALYPLALQGLYCYAPRAGDEAAFVRTDQWLGAALPPVEPAHAQTELLRRYLRCYGPSCAQHFGEWAGVAPSVAERAWSRATSELLKVEIEGEHAWLHQADLRQLSEPPTATGVRLLPPHDPYLSLRDRVRLLPVVSMHGRIWRQVGNPGVLLSDGRVVGLWRPQKKGKRLLVTVEALAVLSESAQSEVGVEVGQMAISRGCATVEVMYLN